MELRALDSSIARALVLEVSFEVVRSPLASRHFRERPCATSSNASIITRNKQASGSSPLVGSLVFNRFAGETQSRKEAPVLCRGLFSATALQPGSPRSQP